MSEKVIYSFGPVGTLDFDKVNEVIRRAHFLHGENFDIEFADTDDDLESYIEAWRENKDAWRKKKRMIQNAQFEALCLCMAPILL